MHPSMYSIQGLWTAGELRLPMTFVIIRNGRYQALENFGPQFCLSRTIGTKLPALDFVALATGHGKDACRVEHLDALQGVLQHALAAEKPTLVEVVVT
jgi:benzoylformate decarboxylase